MSYSHDMRKVIMPNGKTYTYYKSENQSWQEIVREKILPDWQEYCNTHWIDHTNYKEIWSYEKKVHAFLDRIGWLCILDDIGDVESEYKSNVHKVREIPASECPPEISDLMYSDETPPLPHVDDIHFNKMCDRLDAKKVVKKASRKKRVKTRFEKIEEIKKVNSGAVFEWCYVNADNTFSYHGREYIIPSTVECYRMNDDGWAMDKILVVDNGDRLTYFDQSLNPIDF